MAAGSQQKRIIRIPVSAQQVNSEVLSKLISLKLAGTNIFITQGIVPSPLALTQSTVNQYEAILSSTNDTTLQASFAAWATLLGVAALDTEVATFSAGN